VTGIYVYRPSEEMGAMPEPNATRAVELEALADAQLVQLAQQRDGAAFRIIMQRNNRRSLPDGSRRGAQ
jgi:hypothetical protein